MWSSSRPRRRRLKSTSSFPTLTDSQYQTVRLTATWLLLTDDLSAIDPCPTRRASRRQEKIPIQLSASIPMRWPPSNPIVAAKSSQSPARPSTSPLGLSVVSSPITMSTLASDPRISLSSRRYSMASRFRRTLISPPENKTALITLWEGTGEVSGIPATQPADATTQPADALPHVAQPPFTRPARRARGARSCSTPMS